MNLFNVYFLDPDPNSDAEHQIYFRTMNFKDEAVKEEIFVNYGLVVSFMERLK